MGARSSTRRTTRDPDGSLGEWLAFIGPPASQASSILTWPPDTFAIAAALLRRTGAYVNLVNGGATSELASAPGERSAAEVGQEWRENLEAVIDRRHGSPATLRAACPNEVAGWWRVVRRASQRPLVDSIHDPVIVQALTSLCVASDSACAGIGITGGRVDAFLAAAEGVLLSNDRRSFCQNVSPAKLGVLAKQHTPQRGCTIRSLTHNLALYSATEIQPYWAGPFELATSGYDVFNLLLLPWPTEVQTGDFSIAPPPDGAPHPHTHRHFDYAPQVTEDPDAIARRVARALDRAARGADRIHGIVLPELALTQEQFYAIERLAVSRSALLISGLRGTKSKSTNDMSVNSCAIQPMGLINRTEHDVTSETLAGMRRTQLKHHRWCLDRDQILQYELGGRLPASHDCWERAFIGPRTINFVTLGEWLTVCVLICEDLARQDPVTEVIRAVGPNLVFALLMDGPQLRHRWSSRYASVLAEDPGTSVLSLTSLGMARRSKAREPGTPDKSTTIALWRDMSYGEREIALSDAQHDACVLSLVCKKAEEFTIDGRGDGQRASFPVYAGHYSFAVPGES